MLYIFSGRQMLFFKVIKASFCCTAYAFNAPGVYMGFYSNTRPQKQEEPI